MLKSALGLAAAAAMPKVTLADSVAKVTSTALGDKLVLVSGVGGNVVALRSDEGLLLVDSGEPGATGKLQSELKQFASGAKVQTLINTHWHAAQTGGNETFGKAGAKIIAHAKTAQRMAVDQYVPWEDRYTKALPRAAVPTEVFYYGTKDLVFGGEHLQYGYLQQPHTDGDLYVYFRDSNVLVVGDAVRRLVIRSSPGMRAAGSADAWIRRRSCWPSATTRRASSPAPAASSRAPK